MAETQAEGGRKDDAEEVEVVVVPDPIVADPKEQRRKRKRNIRRLVKRANGAPSFLTLLTANLDESPDEDSSEDEVSNNRPKREPIKHKFLIDVDVEIGLKRRDSSVANYFDPVPEYALSESNATAGKPSPVDEGWYEGIVAPMFQPEDTIHLSELQQWVRNNLEFFSVTEKDLNIQYSGRRIATSIGRVGVRCLHCSQSIHGGDDVPKESMPLATKSGSEVESSDAKIWPNGSVSYPANIAGIHSACTQKPQLHFIQCPNLPPAHKAQLEYMMKQSATTTNKRTKRSGGAIPSALYYSIAAKRLGMVDTEDGIRFGRDLSLGLLPLETVKLQFEDQLPAYSRNPAAFSPNAASTAAPMTRLTADEESERVLAEALTENDDPAKSLSRSSDKAFVTDYIFLAVRQMGICHATPFDFATRGKKTKLMRFGFAGFSCRHCQDANDASPQTTPDHSCRSFLSSSDNLSSAISNSFTSHLMRCGNVPVRLKKALSAYKRIHPRQMTQLPHGSQRRLILEIWSRLRDADISEEEMKERIKNDPTLQAPLPAPPPDEPSFVPTQKSVPSPKKPKAVATLDDTELPVDTTKHKVPVSFPRPTDPETLSILKRFETDWDGTENGGLILPEDRNLVSDFVFLTMRQLRIAFPDQSELQQRSKRGALPKGAVPGVGCIHCKGMDHHASPSGRSFPSAPDNFASCLNSSLYNHMRVCPNMPSDIKKALIDTRRIHSAQCSSLKFGSQRRFFKMLYDRLGKAQEQAPPEKQQSEREAAPKGYIFLPPSNKTSVAMAVCERCRMVPLPFRFDHSVLVASQFSTQHGIVHQNACRGSRPDPSRVHSILNTLVKCEYKEDWNAVLSDSFSNLIAEAVGRNDAVLSIFTKEAHQFHLQQNRTATDNGNVPAVSTDKVNWHAFPSPVEADRILQVFREHAKEHNLTTDLRLLPRLTDFLLLLAPFLCREELLPGDAVVLPVKVETTAPTDI